MILDNVGVREDMGHGRVHGHLKTEGHVSSRERSVAILAKGQEGEDLAWSPDLDEYRQPEIGRAAEQRSGSRSQASERKRAVLIVSMHSLRFFGGR